MKKLFLSIFATFILLPAAYTQLISAFGLTASDDELWSYNAANSTISGTETVGAVLYGDSFTANLSTSLGISLNLNVAQSPGSSFSVGIYDNTDKEVLIFGWEWSDFLGGATIYKPYGTIQPGFNFSNVAYWNINSGNSGNPMAATFISMTAAIPEPSTFALLAIGSGAFLIMRKRRKLS